MTFLEQVTGGDPALIAYLQKVFGYSLTGSTQEHALFFLYGTGANGKSVFVNTLADILGDYATNAPMDPTDLSPSLGEARLMPSPHEHPRPAHPCAIWPAGGALACPPRC